MSYFVQTPVVVRNHLLWFIYLTMSVNFLTSAPLYLDRQKKWKRLTNRIQVRIGHVIIPYGIRIYGFFRTIVLQTDQFRLQTRTNTRNSNFDRSKFSCSTLRAMESFGEFSYSSRSFISGCIITQVFRIFLDNDRSQLMGRGTRTFRLVLAHFNKASVPVHHGWLF